MSPNNVVDSLPARLAVQTPREPWFTGLTWKGIGLVTLLCAINAVRRSMPNLFAPDAFIVDNLASTLFTAAKAMVGGLIVAVPVVLAVVATYNLAPRRVAARYAALALAVVVSTLIGVASSVSVEFFIECLSQPEICAGGEPSLRTYVGAWTRYGSLSALFTVVFVYLRAAEESLARAQDAERDRARFVQRMEEARLRMLQAQIEPHFLFNTLANVRRLYQTDHADADRMMGNLMRYLEVALPQMRVAESTLGREAALTESYLTVQQIRMGRRLAFDLEIPEALRDARLPPMMLLTLAENAIKHGLAPLREGGTVRVSASTDGRELLVRVADSGQGFTQTSGGGTGLANIRARLSGLHGTAGRLTLALNTPRGVIATLAVPLAATSS
jgi:hypothetical protein